MHVYVVNKTYVYVCQNTHAQASVRSHDWNLVSSLTTLCNVTDSSWSKFSSYINGKFCIKWIQVYLTKHLAKLKLAEVNVGNNTVARAHTETSPHYTIRQQIVPIVSLSSIVIG